MTFREKVTEEHPENLDNKYMGGVEGCPHSYGYERHREKNHWCRLTTCSACWDREMPSTEEKPHILDSGERRQFETGAVRDIQEGKGRCDLMPLEVVANILHGDLHNSDLVVGRIAHFKNSGYKETFHLYSALFHFAEGWPKRELDVTATFADIFLEVAKHFEEGAKKYGENNWQKGLPVHCYIDSAVRHYLKWLRGDKDEPHDRAFVWNLMCCIWEVDFSPRAKGDTAVADTITLYADNSPMEYIHGDLVRYGDCPAGLFELGDEGVFVKTEIADADKYGAYIAIHVNTGRTRLFDNDILVRPIDSPFTDERCGDDRIHKRANVDRCADMAIELFEHSTQDLILIEEMSELTKALLKLRRGKSSMNEIAEEMAHVLISVEVVRRILGIEDVALEREACKKLNKYGYECAFIIDDTPIETTPAMWPRDNPHIKKEVSE